MKTISTLTNSDLNEAYQVELLCQPIPWSKATFTSNQGDRYLNKKITLNNQLVGFLICQVVIDEATLFNIAIHPDFQKQGLGSILLTQLISELEHQNTHTLWLEVRASNQAAIALYQRMGFNEITIRKNYYPTAQGKEDAIIMAYTISL